MTINVVYGYKFEPKYFLETFYDIEVEDSTKCAAAFPGAGAEYDNAERFMHINKIIDLAKLYDKDPNWTASTIAQTDEEFKTYQNDLHKHLYVCKIMDTHVIVGTKVMSLPVDTSISLDGLSIPTMDILDAKLKKLPAKYKEVFSSQEPLIYCVMN